MNSTSIIKGAVTHLWQSFHDTFNGFSNIEIFDNSLWKIIPKTYSTTIAVNPDIFDQLMYELSARYSTPEDKGRYGLIYRCVMPEEPLHHVTVTCYSSTNTVSVQGSLHKTWVETVLTDIGEKITDEDKSFVSSHSSHLGPVTSTPSARQPSSSNDSNHSLPNFDLNPDLSEPSVQARLSESSVQARINVCNVKLQTDDMPNETPKLKDKLQSLQDKFKDLNKQLSDYKELRTNFTQLSSAYSELCERNSMLEAELRSLKERHSQSENFIHPKVTNRVHKSPSASHTGISTHNSFSVLKDHLPADTVPSAPSVSLMTPEKQEHTSPSAPSVSLMTPEKQEHASPSAPSVSLMTPEKQVPSSPKPTSTRSSSCKAPNQSNDTMSSSKTNNIADISQPQILIFSNSICKRIDESKFYKGRSVQKFAKSGATMVEVQRLVEQCNYDRPKYVILQGWTNNITRESIADCEDKARQLIEAALNKFPSAHIIVSSILPRLITHDRSNAPNRIICELNSIFEQNCRDSARVSFVNHESTFVADDGYINHNLYWDHIHLNNKGLEKLVINLRGAIDSLSLSHPIWNNHHPIT